MTRTVVINNNNNNNNNNLRVAKSLLNSDIGDPYLLINFRDSEKDIKSIILNCRETQE